ncbi:MAG: 16S rRNA (cytosine(1402)-N(4))-methyltransferase [Acidobacteria bacterium]|nr:MAG: 16S rRNA (cytosine(1402)-N(4))-methyltransferase [Acidobacteriota bacterium]
MGALHEPVLLAETLELLAVRPGGFWVDGTVGAGGHAAEILTRSAPDGRLLASDRDAEALAAAAQTLAPFAARARLLQADYRELPALIEEPPDGILLDLGVSSLQLDRAERGFSLKSDGPLDMRMDRRGGITAADVVNRLPEAELADIIYRYGEERASRRIARRIVETRRRSPFRSTLELAEVVRSAARRPRGRGIDAATLTFQALRIHVNRELEGLGDVLASLARRLAPRGRLAVIAFHSLEDREVKQAFRSLAAAGFRLLTRKPVRPGEDEVRRNARSRSARLRAIEREAA